MPPVTKAGGSAFRKDVAFAEKDADEQVGTGIVMVPDKADLQNDFAREDLIREFADQFETFAEAGQAGGGIMHAVWPDGWMELERNEVLDESEEIGGETVAAGAWVQSWKVDNTDLWELINEGILEGYSIGAIQVDWAGPFEQDEDAVEDVDTSAIPDDELVWELTDGIVREVSAVDIPAVPDAEILEAKDLDKRLAEHVGNRDAFIEEAMERGHSEDDAEQLWDVLNEAMEADGAGEPGKQSRLRSAGKAFLDALTGGDGESRDGTGDSAAAQKAGQTLSQANRESAMAAVDANLDMLADAGMDVPKRFTDRDDVDFDLKEHEGGHAQTGDHGDDEGEDDDPLADTIGADAPTDKDAPGGETPDNSPNMSDDDGGDKTLAEKNAEQIDELTDAVKSLTEAVQDGGGNGVNDPEKTAEVELPDGSVAEVSKAEVLSWFDDDGDAGGVGGGDGPVPATKEDVEALHQRLDSITRQSGTATSTQATDDGGDDPDDGLDAIGKALS